MTGLVLHLTSLTRHAIATADKPTITTLVDIMRSTRTLVEQLHPVRSALGQS